MISKQRGLLRSLCCTGIEREREMARRLEFTRAMTYVTIMPLNKRQQQHHHQQIPQTFAETSRGLAAALALALGRKRALIGIQII